MKCILCESFSLLHVCKKCQQKFLTPSLHKRSIENIPVISFYKYDDIKALLHTKHTDLGYYMYTIMAANSFRHFGKNFRYDHQVYSIAIDDTTSNGYSHTAILSKALQSKCIHPFHGILRAQNIVKYSGKSKEYREKNPRKFALKEFQGNSVILVDDIITTGSTIQQAINTMQNNGKEILFCLTLADANLKKSL